jgi:DNA repair photolyase
MRPTYREEPCRSALNRVEGMPFRWSLNPYTGCAHRCAFCYVRAFERRAERASDERYGTDVRIKTNFVDVLRGELKRPSWARESVVLGAATDPYQPAESRYHLSRGAIAALSDAWTPFEIITRGPLILRDLDLLVRAARRVRVRVHVSIITLDESVWRRLEPGAPSPRARLKAVRALSEAGIDVGVAVAPVLPGLTDDEEALAAVVRAAREAGAVRVWARELYLQPGTKEHFLAALERGWPGERARYERLYARGAYLPRAEGERVRGAVRALAHRHRVMDRREVRLEPEAAPPPLAGESQLALGF